MSDKKPHWTRKLKDENLKLRQDINLLMKIVNRGDFANIQSIDEIHVVAKYKHAAAEEDALWFGNSSMSTGALPNSAGFPGTNMHSNG